MQEEQRASLGHRPSVPAQRSSDLVRRTLDVRCPGSSRHPPLGADRHVDQPRTRRISQSGRSQRLKTIIQHPSPSMAPAGVVCSIP